MLKYLIPFILLGFTACELNEDELLKSIVGVADEVPDGTYVSQCVLSESGTEGSVFTLNLAAGVYTIQEDTYTDTECLLLDSTGVPGEEISADLPGPDLGSGFSFFTLNNGLKVPYYYKDAELILGEPQESLPSGDDDFSGFQRDVEEGKIAVYVLQPGGE